jgi:hypothetical protein
VARTFRPWGDLAELGVPIHFGEMGCYKHTSPEVVLAWFDDTLSVLNDLHTGWALWNFRGPFGILDTERFGTKFEDWHGHQLDRALLNLLQKRIKSGTPSTYASSNCGLLRLPVMAFRRATGLNFACADRHADGLSISGGTTPALYDRVKAVFPEAIIFFPLSLNETQVLALVDDFLASRVLFSRGVILGAPGLAGD